MFGFDAVVCFGIRSALHAFVFKGTEFQHVARLAESDLPISAVSFHAFVRPFQYFN